MKKIVMFLSILTISLFLVSCKNSGAKIVSQKFEGNTYTFVVSSKDELTTDDQIEFTYNVANTLYTKLKTDIGNKKRVLKITLQTNKKDSLTLIFNINESVEKPGLNLLNEFFH